MTPFAIFAPMDISGTLPTMAISYNNGMKLLAELNQCIADPYDPNELFQFDLDDGHYLQFSNPAYQIEFFVVRKDEDSRLKSKAIARLLDTFLREGDAQLINGVLVGTLESFRHSSERPHLSTKAIADVMPPTLRAAYLEEMGETELDTE